MGLAYCFARLRGRLRTRGKAVAVRIATMARTSLALAAGLLLTSLPATAQVTAFVDGRVIDGAGKVTERGTVVVRDGVIVEVGPAASVRVPDGATRMLLHRAIAALRKKVQG